MEILPFDQYIVKVNGSNRLTKRNRRFLRVYEPAFPVTADFKPIDDEPSEQGDIPASDWGARVPLPNSSDPVDVDYAPAPVLRDNERQAVYTQQESEPVNNIPRVSPETVVNMSPEEPAQREPVIPVRRSTRATKGQTSKFEDFVTGQDFDD